MKTLFKNIRHALVAGLAVLIPGVATVFIIYHLFNWIDNILPDLIGVDLPPGSGIVGILSIVLLTGLVAKNLFGTLMVKLLHSVFMSIPLLNKVYQTFQQIVDLFLNPRHNILGKPAMIEYPRKNLWVLGFITTYETDEISEATGHQVVCVYVPTTPNPTSGLMVYVPKTDIIEVGISQEIALKAVVSAGMVSSAKTDTRKTGHSLPELITEWKRLARKRDLGGMFDPRD